MHVRHYLHGNGTNPLRTILSIGLSFLTFGVGTGAIFGLSGLAGAAAAAGIFVAGNMLINAIAPIKEDSAGGQTPEKVVRISSKRIRSFDIRPRTAFASTSQCHCCLGTRRVYPDLVMQPYTRFENNDQYLHLLYSTGIGDLAYADPRIGETHIEEYSGVTTEFIAPGENVTIFDDNVITVPGAELNDTASPLTREFNNSVRKVEVDLEGTAFTVDNDGDTTPKTVAASAVITNTDTNTAVSTTAISIAGLSANASTPVRKTFSFDISSRANHKITITRTTAKSANNRVQDSMTAPSIRFFRDGPFQQVSDEQDRIEDQGHGADIWRGR